MKIVTLTLNPAFDTHVSLDSLVLHHENFATVLSTDAGGKGVNISRALTANGEENLAVIITGAENESAFIQKLKEDGLSCSTVSVPGRIRENMTVHEKSGKETRISFDGFSCEKKVLDRVGDAVGQVDENTTVTLTGSNPVGFSVSDVTELLRAWKEKGAKIVIDSRSFTPADLVAFGPWLIKPNKSEAAAFAGHDVRNVEDAAKTALAFHQKGVENVLISLGPEGAVLACKEGLLYATAPDIPVISTIGAGDSMIAGFVSAASHGLCVEDTLIRAVAFGTAACIQNGTRPPLPRDVQKIQKQIQVTKLSL
ncbi:MAG: 1-phosphofructokinase family hexose kinase [Clostridia bacterium]|nr:1-phosphofructokinase family hexose kinase [Clostridia bacterium]